jgi:hypothetical protein
MNLLKSSLVISLVNVELKTEVSEISVSAVMIATEEISVTLVLNST